ncbi:hypothetical protein [Symbioplanes lichenis]|uniref:hypothetical protein n=1 Tax=Symbioplanes lichenis TaxID=1629072 RepID=UPI002738571D|nr:hypothetical protein [Actinoplanes lichenis]
MEIAAVPLATPDLSGANPFAIAYEVVRAVGTFLGGAWPYLLLFVAIMVAILFAVSWVLRRWTARRAADSAGSGDSADGGDDAAGGHDAEGSHDAAGDDGAGLATMAAIPPVEAEETTEMIATHEATEAIAVEEATDRIAVDEATALTTADDTRSREVGVSIFRS